MSVDDIGRRYSRWFVNSKSTASIFIFLRRNTHAMHSAMKNKLSLILLLTSSLTLAACGEMGQQWLDPDTTFAKLGQPDIKGVNDTEEEMAKQAVEKEDFLRGAQFYQQLVSGEKGTPEQKLRYKMGLADAVRRLGQVQSALAMYDTLHSENPDNLDIAEGRGLTLMAAGKVPDAGRVFSAVIEKDPKRWRSLNALGLLFITKNMIPEAMAYFEEALNQSPDNPAVLNNIGLASAINHDYTKAVESLGYATRLSKANAQRRQIDLNLALVYGVSGDMEKARDVASKYLEGATLDNNMGLYAHLSKDDALAKSYLNMALSQSPIYYQRAWENLDTVANTSPSDDDQNDSSFAGVKVEEGKPTAPKPAASKPKEVAKPKVKPEKEETKASTAGATKPAISEMVEAKKPEALTDKAEASAATVEEKKPASPVTAEKEEASTAQTDAPSVWDKVPESKSKETSSEENPVKAKEEKEEGKKTQAQKPDSVKTEPAKTEPAQKSKKESETTSTKKKAKPAAAKKKPASKKHKTSDKVSDKKKVSEKKTESAPKADSEPVEKSPEKPIDLPAPKKESPQSSPETKELKLPPLPMPTKDELVTPTEGN